MNNYEENTHMPKKRKFKFEKLCTIQVITWIHLSIVCLWYLKVLLFLNNKSKALDFSLTQRRIDIDQVQLPLSFFYW